MQSNNSRWNHQYRNGHASCTSGPGKQCCGSGFPPGRGTERQSRPVSPWSWSDLLRDHPRSSALALRVALHLGGGTALALIKSVKEPRTAGPVSNTHSRDKCCIWKGYKGSRDRVSLARNAPEHTPTPLGSYQRPPSGIMQASDSGTAERILLDPNSPDHYGLANEEHCVPRTSSTELTRDRDIEWHDRTACVRPER